MPDIRNQYHIAQVPFESVYQEVVESLKQIGAIEIKETVASEQSKTVEGFVQSAWGWGGMSVKISVEKGTEDTILTAGGYIAQLATSPLAKKLDEFLGVLAQRLQTTYGYTFTYERMNTFMPKFSYQMNKKDMTAIGAVLLFGLVLALVGVVFGRAEEALLSGLAVGLGYYFGRKYFYKK